MAPPFSYQVIRDATETIRSLLVSASGTGGLLQGVTVEVEIPTETYTPASRPALTLFLYRVVENTYLRNLDRVRKPNPARGSSADDPAFYLEYEPPLGLNLFYALVPWHDSRIAEHMLLGQAMTLLHENRVLAPAVQVGFLKEQEENLTLRLLTESEYTLEEQSRLWSALKADFRLSVSYELRVVKLEPLTGRPGGRVLEKMTGIWTGPPAAPGEGE